MTATLEPLAADEVYTAQLERPRQSSVHRAVNAALDLWCAGTGGTFDLSSSGDVVVRRRSDGVEEFRVHAGQPRQAAPILGQLADDLAALSPEEFRRVWGIA